MQDKSTSKRVAVVVCGLSTDLKGCAEWVWLAVKTGHEEEKVSRGCSGSDPIMLRWWLDRKIFSVDVARDGFRSQTS